MGILKCCASFLFLHSMGFKTCCRSRNFFSLVLFLLLFYGFNFPLHWFFFNIMGKVKMTDSHPVLTSFDM